MHYLVTGAAGFIGAHLCRTLLERGHQVVGVDAMVDYYDVSLKEARLRRLGYHPSFHGVRADLAEADLDGLVEGQDAVVHLAGQPGVRLSWDRHFDLYVRRNVLASQRVLEAVRRTRATRLVVASSSSVYGNSAQCPTTEESPTRPYSPYGVTKLAMEHLCWSYAENWGVDVVALRYFTVYGPGQRPDMALHRFIRQTLDGETITVFGDGQQVRDFTFVSDVVDATVSSTVADLPPGTAINVAGGSQATIHEVLGLVAQHTGVIPAIDFAPPQPGDVRATGGSIVRAERLLGWTPRTSLSDGIARHVAAVRSGEVETVLARSEELDVAELETPVG